MQFESIAAGAYGSRTNTTVTAPTGIQEGDLLLLAFVGGNSGEAPDPTAPAGFDLLPGSWPIDVTGSGFNLECRVYGKLAEAGDESATDYTVTHDGASTQGVIVRFSGPPVDWADQTQTTLNSGTGSTSTATGISTEGADSMVVYLGFDFAGGTNTLSPPGGSSPTFTERLDSTLLYVATGVKASAGPTGDKTQTNNNPGASPWGAVLIAFAEAAVPGAPENTTPAVISGTVRVGETLTLDTPGAWTGTPTPVITWDWQSSPGDDSWETIPDTTDAASLLLDALTEDREFRVLETAVNDEGTTQQPSNSVGPVAGLLGTGFGIGTLVDGADSAFALVLTEDVPEGATAAVIVGWGATGGPRTIDSVTSGALEFAEAHTTTGYDPGLNVDYGLTVYYAFAEDGLATSDEIDIVFDGTVATMIAAGVANAGVTPTAPVDGAAGIFRQYGTAAQAWTSGPVATGHAKDWLLGGAYSINGSAYTNTPLAPLSTELYDFGATAHMAVQDVNVDERGSYAANGSWSAVDYSDLAVMVAFKAGIGSPPPVNVEPPVITGYTDSDGGDDNCEVGDTLTCSTGEWTGGDPMAFEFQWLVGGTQVPIPGETASEYTVDAEQSAVGRQITCRVTATNLDDEAAATSEQLLTVLDADAPDRMVWSGSGWSPAYRRIRLEDDWT